MGKPINSSYKSLGCNPISSECVIYNNQDIPCIDLCVGDSVGDILFGLGTLLCTFVATEYTICGEDDTLELSDMLTSIGTRLCALENAVTPEPVEPFTCSDVKECAWDATALTSVNTQLSEVISTLATQIAAGATIVEDDVLPVLANHESRIEALEDAPEPTFEEPEIIPTCVLPSVPTEVHVVVEALEQQFCTLKAILGNNSELITAIARQCLNLSTDSTLSGTGTMSSIPGWNSSPSTVAGTVNNLWLTLCDIRSAIKDIKQNCCNAACSDFTWIISSSLDASGTIIQFYFDFVVIPSGFAACNPLGATFVLSDGSGNSTTFKVPIQSYAGTTDSFNVTIASTPLNPASNYTAHISSCFYNSATGVTCEKDMTLSISNPAVCPEVVYTPLADSINYAFTGIAGYSYTLDVYTTASPSVLVTTNSHVSVGGGAIEGTLSGLDSEVSYDIIVTVVNTVTGTSTTCPTETIETITGA